MDVLILFTILSPAIPLIVLYYLAYKNKERRLTYLVISLIVSVISTFGGSYLADKASGWDGLGYIGFIFVGQIGMAISLIAIVGWLIINHLNKNKTQHM